MNTVVMKFGGTSLQDAPSMKKAIEIVTGRRDVRAVPVLSATAGTTNALYNYVLARRAGNHDPGELCEQLKIRHVDLAHEMISDDSILRSAVSQIVKHLQSDMCAMSEAEIMSTGEILSSIIFHSALLDRGFRSVLLDSRKCIITLAAELCSAPDMQLTSARTLENIERVFSEKAIPVMQGYIASSESGDASTLGRGGSDFSASLIGAAISASSIEIWTDVTGIMTADPRIVPEASTISSISYSEAEELAINGAKVLHPSTIAPAISSGIPVYVMNTNDSEKQGTRITSIRHYPSSDSPVKSLTSRSSMTLLNLVDRHSFSGRDFTSSITVIFKKHTSSAEILSSSETSLSVVLPADETCNTLLAELEKEARFSRLDDISVISIVGHGIADHSDILSRSFGIVRNSDVIMVTEKKSEISISYAIDDSRREETLRRLHEEFFGNNRTR